MRKLRSHTAVNGEAAIFGQHWLTGTYFDSLEWHTSLEHPSRIFPSARPHGQFAEPVHK